MLKGPFQSQLIGNRRPDLAGSQHWQQISLDSLRSRRRQGAGSLTRLLVVALDCDFAAGINPL